MDSDVYYCNKCGAKLELTIRGVDFYDTKSGISYMKATLKCPNKKHRFFDGHDSWDGTYCEKHDSFRTDSKYVAF